MKKIHSIVPFVFLIIFAFLNQSCTHYYYGPNSANVPLFQKKDDARITAAFAAADESSGFELQSAYAFGNHFGAMFNFYTAYGKRSSSSNSESYSKGSGTYAEIGGGYFTHIGSTPQWIFESYAGVGTGTVNNQYAPSEMSKVNATKLFLQPSFGFSNKKGSFQAAISSRISSVRLNLRESSSSINNSTDNYYDLLDVQHDGSTVFWEPSLLVRTGGKKIKFQLQYTASTPSTEHIYQTQTGIISFGLLFSFNGKDIK